MRAGRAAEASALAQRIGGVLARRNKTRLSHISVKDLWAAVRQMTGRKQSLVVPDGITAESLNHRYARISTDPCYQPPKRKLTIGRRTRQAAVCFTIMSWWGFTSSADKQRLEASSITF